MTNPIKQHIDEALPPGSPPGRLDADTVMRASHNRQTKRRLVGGGAALASIAVVSALVLTVMTMAPGGANGSPDDAADGDKKTEQTEEGQYPYDEYYWEFANGPEYKDEITDASKEYTYAFWAYLTKNHPEATFITGNGEGTDGREEHTGPRDEDGFFGTRSEVMYEGDQRSGFGDENREPVLDRKILSMYERFQPGKGFNGTSCCGLSFLIDKDKVREVHFGIDVYPEGTFTRDTKDRMDPAYFGADVDHEVDSATTDDGDTVVSVEASTEGDADDGTVDTLRYAVVVYRADGSAIAITASSGADGSDDIGDSLSLEDLAGIVLAMPRVPLP